MVPEWAEAKNRSNAAKCSLNLEDAEQVLTGPCVTFVDDLFDYGEKTAHHLGPSRQSSSDVAHALVGVGWW